MIKTISAGKFCPAKALRTTVVKFSKTKAYSTEEYVARHCSINGWIKSGFIINGREVIL